MTVWALPRSLAATYGIDVSFSSSAYLDVSVQRVPSVAYGSHMRVSPFGNPWIVRYVPFPMAYRSLSRPSSAPSAKASAVCPSSLDHPHSVASGHGSSLSYALCVSIIEGVFCRIFTCSACRSFSFNFSVDVLGCLMLSHDKIVMDI